MRWAALRCNKKKGPQKHQKTARILWWMYGCVLIVRLMSWILFSFSQMCFQILYYVVHVSVELDNNWSMMILDGVEASTIFRRMSIQLYRPFPCSPGYEGFDPYLYLVLYLYYVYIVHVFMFVYIYIYIHMCLDKGDTRNRPIFFGFDKPIMGL